MSESGDDERRPGQQGRRRGTAGPNDTGSSEKELASQQVQIQSKRFYIDVKENQRGRFIKLAEVGVGGRKSRIVLSIAAAHDLKQFLGEFSELNAQMGPSQPSQQSEEPRRAEPDAGLIKSETITKDRKRYYLDFKENQRGRFLRISMVLQRGPRAFIAIPAQGLIEFKDHLSDMLDRYGVGFEQEQAQPDLPESKSVKADNKIFYFDSGSNARGVFLKISEVRQSRYRTAITIPQAHLADVCHQINEFLNKLPTTPTDPAPSQQ